MKRFLGFLLLGALLIVGAWLAIGAHRPLSSHVDVPLESALDPAAAPTPPVSATIASAPTRAEVGATDDGPATIRTERAARESRR